MPELPEVETVARALRQECLNKIITGCFFYASRLRSEIKRKEITEILLKANIFRIERRAKYLIIKTQEGKGVIIHLGMSGRVVLLDQAKPQRPHTHYIFELSNEVNQIRIYLHYIDPRRFGLIDIFRGDVNKHPLIAKLGPEPLTQAKLGLYLFNRSRGLKKPVKNFIMDAHILAGVGNIYACEALYKAGISPFTQVNQLNLGDFQGLAKNIRGVLKQAIRAGGTTLRDFSTIDGSSGYFQNKLWVYGRENESCLKCLSPIKNIRLAGRSSFFCPSCQKTKK